MEPPAVMGLGAWPESQSINKYLSSRASDAPGEVSTIQALLKQYGYDQIPQNGIG